MFSRAQCCSRPQMKAKRDREGVANQSYEDRTGNLYFRIQTQLSDL